MLISTSSSASLSDCSSARIDCLSACSLLFGTALAILTSFFPLLARAVRSETSCLGASRRAWEESSVARLPHQLAVFHHRAASHKNMTYPPLQGHSLIWAPSRRRQ